MLKHSLLALVLALTSGGAMAETYRQTETPDYRVEATAGDVELRDYGPRIVAEVTVTGERSVAINAGFRVLAGYIFGDNAGGQKVAMTTPVTQAPTGPDWVVQFTMPKEYSLESLPKPTDARIRFVSLPGTRQVVVRFSGLANAALLEEKAAEAEAWAKSKGLKVMAGPVYSFYDPPWRLPWNRRNEVAFTVK